jgi:predicted nucleotidyltransferase
MVLKLGPLELSWGTATRRKREREAPPDPAALPQETYERGSAAPLEKVAPVPKPPQTDECDLWARQAVQGMGLPLASHGRLVHNLATRARQLSEESRRRLLDGPPGLGTAQELSMSCFSGDGPPLDVYHAGKLERDLEKPYSDAAVDARLKFLESQLRGFLGSCAVDKFWVAGSLVKGDFGANSDLDVVVPGATPPRDSEHDLQIFGTESRAVRRLGELREFDATAFLNGHVRLAG